MNSNQYLNPAAIKSQCEAAVNILEQDNMSLAVSEKSLNLFIGDTEIQAAAFDNLKQQMNDYISISSAMKTANSADIQDFHTLSNVVGDRILDGNRIVQGMTKAEESKQRNMDCASHNRSLSRMYSTTCPPAALYYDFVSNWYDLLAYWDQKEYEKWSEKSSAYDAIEENTCALFQSGNAIREAANIGLEYVGKAFVDGVYAPDFESNWRDKLKETVLNSISGDVLSEEVSITQEELKDMNEIQRADYMQKVMKYFFVCNPDFSPEPGQEYTIIVSPDIKVTYKTSVQAVADAGETKVNAELGGSNVEIESSSGNSTIKATIDHQKMELGEMGVEATLTKNKYGSANVTLSGTGGKISGGVKYTNKYGSECSLTIGSSGLTTSMEYKVSGTVENVKVESSLEVSKYNNPNNPGSGYEPVTEPAFEVDGEKVAQAAGGALAIYCIYRAVKFVVAGGVTIATGGAAAPVMVPAALAP